MEYTIIIYIIIIIYINILHNPRLGPIHVYIFILHYYYYLLYILRIVQHIYLYILVNPHDRIMIKV
jgi:hypothetical protein